MLSAPVSLKIDAIHIDVGILTGQGSVAPGFDVDIGLFVQLADGGSRYLAALKGLSDVHYPMDGYPGQVHLDEGFFHTTLPTAVVVGFRS